MTIWAAMSTTAKTTAKSTTTKVGAVSTKPAAKRAPRKAAAPKSTPAPKPDTAAKPAAKAPAAPKAPKKPAASFTTDEHPETFTCAGACGETKSVKSFPTVDGPAKRATTCRSCRDAARKAKAA